MSRIRPDVSTAIIEAAFEVFSANPSAALGEVAVRAGVGRATLHRHFAGRDALMAALARIATAEIDDAVQVAAKDANTATEALRLSLSAIIPLGDRQGFLALERIEDEQVATEAARQASDLAHWIDVARTEGTFGADVPTPWIAAAYGDLIYTGWTQVKAGEVTAKQAAALAWRMLATGLGPDGGRQAPSKPAGAEA